jgi:hypothetical protein
MRALGAAELLQIWERDEQNPPAARAVSLLAAAGHGNASTLTIGQRDAALLELRHDTFGGAMQAQTRCPACGDAMELTLPVADFIAARASADAHASAWHALVHDDWVVRFRLPTALDVLGVDARCGDLRLQILQRCIADVAHAGTANAFSELPAELHALIAQRMEQLDPCADIQLELTCPACRAAWTAQFDILAYLWAEIATHARRLLREVDVLARGYGWREQDILALSSRRRRAYLELCGV